MEPPNERRIPVYKLLNHKTILKQLLSFSENVDRCNFSIVAGWRGRVYVQDHGLDEFKPAADALRGMDLLEVHYLKLTDYVVLTEEQYKDYKTIIGE